MEMEFRIEKRTGAILIGLVLLSQAMFAQQEFRYEAWHGHSGPPLIKKAGNMGTLTITDTGVSFEETYKDGRKPKHPHAWRWAYQDIQQLKMAPKSLTVLTYKDNKWKLGADEVVSEVSALVGGPQTFLGPVVAVPYAVPATVTKPGDKGVYIIFP